MLCSEDHFSWMGLFFGRNGPSQFLNFLIKKILLIYYYNLFIYFIIYHIMYLCVFEKNKNYFNKFFFGKKNEKKERKTKNKKERVSIR